CATNWLSTRPKGPACRHRTMETSVAPPDTPRSAPRPDLTVEEIGSRRDSKAKDLGKDSESARFPLLPACHECSIAATASSDSVAALMRRRSASWSSE